MDDRERLRALLLDAHRLADQLGEGVIVFFLMSALAELNRDSAADA